MCKLDITMNALSNLKYDYILSLDDTPYTDRLIHRRTEALLASLLTLTYASYTEMMLMRDLSMQPKHPYNVAEKLSEWFSSMYDYEIKPEHLLHDRDNCVDESLEHYETMCVFINKLEEIGYDKEDIMTFCKQVEDGNEALAQFKDEIQPHYALYAAGLFFYLTDHYTYEELIVQFVRIDLFTKTVSPANPRPFIRDMRKALDLFYEIVVHPTNA